MSGLPCPSTRVDSSERGGAANTTQHAQLQQPADWLPQQSSSSSSNSSSSSSILGRALGWIDWLVVDRLPWLGFGLADMVVGCAATAGAAAAAAPLGLAPLGPPRPRHGGGFVSLAACSPAPIGRCVLRGWARRREAPASIGLDRFLCGYMRVDGREDGGRDQGRDDCLMFGPDDDNGSNIPTQVETLVRGTATVPTSEEYKSIPDLDYLQELLAIQQQGPRAIGFFGTRNMGFMHQQLIEILSYAMVITKNHIFTSGASGTNAAVIRGALRAEKPELLTVILPQSLKKQPPESQELLSKVQNLIEKPQYDHLPLIEASRLCNMDIISKVQQVICFAFHDSKLLMETCQEAKNLRKIVTLFYLD